MFRGKSAARGDIGQVTVPWAGREGAGGTQHLPRHVPAWKEPGSLCQWRSGSSQGARGDNQELPAQGGDWGWVAQVPWRMKRVFPNCPRVGQGSDFPAGFWEQGVRQEVSGNGWSSWRACTGHQGWPALGQRWVCRKRSFDPVLFNKTGEKQPECLSLIEECNRES